MTPARWAAVVAVAFALYFAIQGGEYGTTHLLQLRRERVAREAFGMIRKGEHLFRIVPGDTARRLRLEDCEAAR